MQLSRLPLALASAALLLPLASFASAAGEGAWPQWRGPDRDGVSKETGWSVEGAAEPLWKQSVGLGYSTVSIAGGRLYTQGFDQKKQEDTIWCLDAKSGAVLWKYCFPAKIWNMGHGGGSLCTPSIDGDVVRTFNREGNYFCFDAKSGKLLEKKQIQEEFGLKPPTWGFAASPLVLDDAVILNAGQVLCFDKQGELRWKSEKNYGHAYSTPATFAIGGKPCLATCAGSGLAVLERASGKELGFHEWKVRYEINAASPVPVGERVFISSGYHRGCALFELRESGLEIVWENKSISTQVAGCILHGDHLYGTDEKTLKCIDLDGAEKWAAGGFDKGAILIAGDRILGISEQGELVIARATPEGYEELGRRKVLDGGPFWSTPVLLDGLIYCRSHSGELVCLDHRAKK